MGLFSGLFGRKTKEQAGDEAFENGAPQAQPVPAPQFADLEFDVEDSAPLDDMTHAVKERAQGVDTDVNIWDLDDGMDDMPAPAPSASAEATISPVTSAAAARSRRNRTRLIGFDKSDGEVVGLFEGAPAAAPSGDRTQFPVGWILVVDGPGRGFSFPLVAGMSQIGRGEDQSIALDFGDTAISRNNHAAIVYDPAERTFLLGHGGKANIVRLNDKPVISNEALSDGDKIQIGETTLQLKTLCGPDFDWSDADGEEEQEDVAIA